MHRISETDVAKFLREINTSPALTVPVVQTDTSPGSMTLILHLVSSTLIPPIYASHSKLYIVNSKT